jgi:TP901 family phage tail tape measure protein
MANVLEIIIQADNQASGVLSTVLGNVESLGGSVARTGIQMGLVAAPFVTALTTATYAAVDFDKTMTNTAAVLGQTREETAALSQEILDMGATSIVGPQALNEAFYDVVGGVTDAASRMDILETSMHVAQAGAADMGATTSAMISVMNSYSFSAEQAAFAGDVMTRAVGMGVGSMEELAGVMPMVAGTMNAMGIGFDEGAAQLSYITTKGYSWSQAGTMMNAMMGALMSPTADLADLIHSLGYESGQAMVDQYGLAGAYQVLAEANGGSVAGIIQNQEALRGALALTADGFTEYADTFIGGIEGATAAAEEIQLSSPAAQIAQLQNAMGALSIEVGTALLPAINDIVQGVRPLIIGFTQWLRANPQVVSTVIAVVGAVAGLGTALVGIGGVISGVAGVFGALLNPVTWIIGAIGLLGTAFATNFMGIRDAVEPVITGITTAVQNFFNFLSGGSEPLSALSAAIGLAFGPEVGSGVANFVQGIVTGIGGVVSFITGTVLPALSQLVSWFITDGLPLAVNFVTGVVVPAVQGFITTLGNIWAVVGPVLFSLIDWFITTGLPAAVNFVQTVVVPAVEGFIATLVRVWNDVSPFLVSLFDWFINTGLPAISSFITDTVVPIVQDFISFLSDLWLAVQPHLEELYNWFVVDALPAIQEFIEGPVTTAIEGITTLISGIWDAVRPALEGFYNFFIDNIGTIVDVVITPLKNAFDEVLNIGGDVLEFIGDAASQFGDFVSGVFGGGSNVTAQGLPSRDSGGMGVAGQAYYIGTGAQPELFVPQTDGTFLTPAQYGAGAGGGGGMTINGLTINANSYAEGQAAADGFQTRMSQLEEERRRRG